MRRDDIEFKSEGTTCRGWHYWPEGEGKKPCIVIGHGFAGTHECRLDAYAARFAAAGFHAFVFDYRHFGASDGEPRQLISVPRQQADWKAAIATARALPGVDAQKIGLWGSSYSGGHVVHMAVSDGGIGAISAQCPMLDAERTFAMVNEYAGPKQLRRLALEGLKDVIGSWIGLKPRMIPAVSEPGTLGVMTTPESKPGYLAITPSGFRNEVCARFFITGEGSKNDAIKIADKLNCPVLVQICDRDSLVSNEGCIEFAKKTNGLAEVKHYPAGHFDIYIGEMFEKSIADEIDFFTRHLMGK